MDTSQIGLFELADQRLSYLDQKQVLLSQNIANIDTPKWVEQDLKPFSASLSQFTSAAAPVMTNPLHMAGTVAGAQASRIRPQERAPDGNTIDLSTQLTKIAAADNAHELVTDLYKKYLGLFRTALGRSS